MLKIGSVVEGKYKVLNKIGQGGMSIVYLAMNERANKQWAIKEVRKDGKGSSEVMRQSLIAETEMLKKLHHPNLPSIIDVIDNGDALLIVMDYIEGNPLSQAIENFGALNQDDVVAWGIQLCGVLGYLHSRKPPIVYRDLKPSNIMLKPNGEVMLIDFGTAREFKPGNADDTMVLGTQGYAAPEQFGIHQTDARTDIYNLGATLYHLVTGHNPSEPPYVMHPIRHWNPELSSGLEQILAKCTQRDPLDRYQSAAELLFALEKYHELDHEYRAAQSRKLRRFLVSSALAGLFLLGVLGFTLARSAQMASGYSALLSQAQNLASASSTAEVAALYIQAANLDPTRGEAFDGLLRIIKSDQVFSESENQLLRSLLNESTGFQSTNIETLKTANPQAYGSFSFDLGIAYFFIYEGNGDKARAASWLNAASESPVLSEQKASLARRLALIANNYEAFLRGSNTEGGVTSLLTEDEFGPRAYWDELVALSEGDMTAITGNTFVSIGVYRELIYQIHEHARLFAEGNVSKTEMITQINKAMDGLKELVTHDAQERESIADALRLAEETRKTIQSVEGGQGTEGGQGAQGTEGVQVSQDVQGVQGSLMTRAAFSEQTLDEQRPSRYRDAAYQGLFPNDWSSL